MLVEYLFYVIQSFTKKKKSNILNKNMFYLNERGHSLRNFELVRPCAVCLRQNLPENDDENHRYNDCQVGWYYSMQKNRKGLHSKSIRY